eukprot:m.28255 g.28255  ORF g.28255 m.28255 type:complete len:506 (+) comp10422_c0_seq2:337-1854(+)
MSTLKLQTSTPSYLGGRPKDVGIIAMDVYFPSMFVSQRDLEQYDGVSEGKYTIGLGQSNMAVCSNSEDINSVCMTAVANLMEKYNIAYSAIGRIEVGTESLVDKSKAVKTALMDMFQQNGNTDIEGVDSKNACYGGTAAVLNSLAWVESSAWDGRYAIAIAGDIAVYEKGPARPTGGAGVVAMLIGPNAPLVVEPIRATHMEHVWDFYKPTMASEYPRVDGHLSNECYLRALDNCYLRYAAKWNAWQQKPWSLTNAAYSIFHAPYNKLVQKSFGRLVYHEYREHGGSAYAQLAPYAKKALEETYNDREFIKVLGSVSKPVYEAMVKPTELITKECGNSYCGSLYAGLLSLITNKAEELPQNRILLFSYGSGLAATLFSIRVANDVTYIRDTADVTNRLASRKQLEPAKFEQLLAEREKEYTRYDFSPEAKDTELFPGTYYVDRIDNLERRFYARARAMHTLAAAAATLAQRPTSRLAYPPASMLLSAQARAVNTVLQSARRLLRK